jgi:hypothetical protein
MWKKVWNDPVWSKVIAGCILMGGGTLLALISDTVKNYFLEKSTQNWIVWLISLATVGISTYAIQLKRLSSIQPRVSSTEWFSTINEKLKDCGYARIYLRNFNHPDDFRDEHKEVLLSIIRTIKEKIRTKSDIQILSYKPNGERSGDDWLEAELGERENIKSHVKILRTQPMANSSSMYLFDDRFVVFNKIDDGITAYHVEKHSNSILFELIKRGFEEIWRIS